MIPFTSMTVLTQACLYSNQLKAIPFFFLEDFRVKTLKRFSCLA